MRSSQVCYLKFLVDGVGIYQCVVFHTRLFSSCYRLKYARLLYNPINLVKKSKDSVIVPFSLTLLPFCSVISILFE